jgi:uncharacterized protein (DUF488 family)
MIVADPLRGVLGVGYAGHSLDGFVGALLVSRVALVMDVRLRAISRKPGFSKRALASALADAGIGYEHAPELGNPAWNRPGFSGSPAEVMAARARFGRVIANDAAETRIGSIVSAARSGVVAVMCVEADDRACHRQVVLSQVHGRAGQLAPV